MVVRTLARVTLLDIAAIAVISLAAIERLPAWSRHRCLLARRSCCGRIRRSQDRAAHPARTGLALPASRCAGWCRRRRRHRTVAGGDGRPVGSRAPANRVAARVRQRRRSIARRGQRTRLRLVPGLGHALHPRRLQASPRGAAVAHRRLPDELVPPVPDHRRARSDRPVRRARRPPAQRRAGRSRAVARQTGARGGRRVSSA